MKLFGLSPSREVGQLKEAIKEAILEGIISNSYDDAYPFMIEKAKKMGLSLVADANS